MPTLTQGNVFDAAQRTPLAVVFGYTGFNLMSMYWREFAQRTHKLSNLANPFGIGLDSPSNGQKDVGFGWCPAPPRMA